MTNENVLNNEDKDIKPSILNKIADGYHDGKQEAENEERARAAVKIQKVWRQQNGRARLQKEYLSPELRWKVFT